MGYSGQPFVAAFHSDTENEHVHIVTTRCLPSGSLVSDHYEARKRFEVASKLELHFGLKTLPKALGRKLAHRENHWQKTFRYSVNSRQVVCRPSKPIPKRDIRKVQMLSDFLGVDISNTQLAQNIAYVSVKSSFVFVRLRGNGYLRFGRNGRLKVAGDLNDVCSYVHELKGCIQIQPIARNPKGRFLPRYRPRDRKEALTAQQYLQAFDGFELSAIQKQTVPVQGRQFRTSNRPNRPGHVRPVLDKSFRVYCNGATLQELAGSIKQLIASAKGVDDPEQLKWIDLQIAALEKRMKDLLFEQHESLPESGKPKLPTRNAPRL